MAWRVAIWNRLVHADFVNAILTDRQIHEISWYYERHPFGHDVDHMMLARIAATMCDKSENELMPAVDSESDAMYLERLFPGAKELVDDGDSQDA